MQILRKIKLAISLLFVCILIVAISIGIQYYNQERVRQRQDKIQELIDKERSGSLSVPSNTNNAETDAAKPLEPGLEDIIQGGINDSLIEPVFSNITMIDSSTFTATLNGETQTYHLIGVADNGDSEKVKLILEQLESITIKRDVVHEKNSIQQVYIWPGHNTDDPNNMINIQIVKQKICGTTYLINSGLSETPNVKYSNLFVSASKT